MILYCKVTKDTAEALARELNLPYKNVFQEPLNERPRKVIRWGVGVGLGYVPNLVVNKMKAVNKATNKLKAVELFTIAGVRTAQLGEAVPCVGRTRTHTQGNNFWLCWEEEQVRTARMEGAEYFIKYIPIKQEYRVHILGGVFSFAQRKYPRDRVSSAFMGIQGFANHWHKKIYTGHVPQDVITTAVNAVNCLGLDFGGVDILVSQDDGLAYVAEVNTGPALPTEEVRRPYVNYFIEKLDL